MSESLKTIGHSNDEQSFVTNRQPQRTFCLRWRVQQDQKGAWHGGGRHPQGAVPQGTVGQLLRVEHLTLGQGDSIPLSCTKAAARPRLDTSGDSEDCIQHIQPLLTGCPGKGRACCRHTTNRLLSSSRMRPGEEYASLQIEILHYQQRQRCLSKSKAGRGKCLPTWQFFWLSGIRNARHVNGSGLSQMCAGTAFELN